MIRILILIALLASPQLYADPYETAQRFTAGDVISAEVLNDILDRIELTLKDVTRSEMIGTWDVTAYNCRNQTLDPVVELSCLDGFSWDGAVSKEGGMFASRADTWTITAVSGSDTQFNLASTNYNLIYNDLNAINYSDLNDGNTHTCVMVGGQAMMSCVLEFPAINPGPGGNDLSDQHVGAYFNMQRLSPTRIKLFWGPWRGAGIFNVLVMDKTDVPPTAPTALSASRTAGTVTLSWTINGSTATGGVVKRKLAFDGSWSTLGTPSTGSYSDSAITLNNSYWYRVFATNANGTSVGSNVVKVTWANTPPSIDLDSSIYIYENATAIVSVGATDVDGDTLTYSISSQSPGSDATYMSITSGGVLSFDSAPDYENPQDYGTNNSYQIKITVSDGIDPVTQNIWVNVMDVSD